MSRKARLLLTILWVAGLLAGFSRTGPMALTVLFYITMRIRHLRVITSIQMATFGLMFNNSTRPQLD